MARRFGVEKTFLAQPNFDGTPLADIPGGSGQVLIAGDTDLILQPELFVLAGNSAGNVEVLLYHSDNPSPDDIFMHVHIGANNTRDISFPNGWELPKGSGVYIQSVLNDASAMLFYHKYDEGTGVTKVESRTASLNPQVTRTPNQFGDDAKT